MPIDFCTFFSNKFIHASFSKANTFESILMLGKIALPSNGAVIENQNFHLDENNYFKSR